jgi:ATP-binding cassette subfamily F protein 3
MGCFLFKGDDVFKKIRVLSGGEKARVALAKTIISKANYLLLDEPTNHLDITSVNMLIQALNNFDGTYVLVSHDRYFIQNVANKIWEIEDGQINEFEGTYQELEEFKKRKAQQIKEGKIEVAAKKEVVVEEKKVEKAPIVEAPKPANNTSEFKEKQKEEKRIRTKFTKLEEELATLNTEKQRLEALLAEPDTYLNKNLFQATESQYNSIALKIEYLQPEYETLFEQLLQFES